MIEIRPASDLKNKFSEVEKTVVQNGNSVFLTENGYGVMVLMSIERYAALTEDVEAKLDEACAFAAANPSRLGHDEVFADARSIIREAI